ncbi:uncharacterized protein CIMG_10294 [Coccidioides immitis RS]|uniref:Zn(2)-C6 fungal-type domain-containing protein n=4 Tax=Coccidioides immitis TaxID=5501 RepID=J3K171_COCIM|nr:uncharacterized protein CIMG_10294 [Coccidioides immitis RS]EAS27689.3 hypothetical protein CIMG_10294 [Coccidioides immitis RS]KMP09660.1 hypothetical protein CIRG_09830 [Coccidioides immitis RMSCC 2394]KMU81413.1 hypothetical protein CISG_09126 [Coccidioides immitis RMSCC 3703]KMU90827.1 hypothetical protein CIHG_08631 [Coccidioides immitis H538.4]
MNSKPGPPSPSQQCYICRKRRIRCDSTKPSCKKCVSKGVECPGYSSQRPLVWLQDGGNQNQYLGEQNVNPSERKKRKKGRPKMLVATDEPDTVSHGSDSQSLSVSQSGDTGGRSHSGSNTVGLSASECMDAIAPSMKFFFPPNISLIVRSLWYFDNFMYPDLDPIIYRPCVHAMDPTSWQDGPTNLFWNILIAVVATHKAVSSQPTDQIEFSKEIYQYKDRTFKILAKDMTDPRTRLGDVTLISVLSLFMAEMQRSAMGEWWTHCEGARRIIDLRGGLRSVYMQNPGLRSNLAYFMLADIMSATTAAALPVAEATRQLEYCALIPDMFQNGLETCVICPNELLDAIIQINHLRSLRHYGIRSITGTDETVGKSIMQSIISFPVSEWADKMSAHYSKTAADVLIGETRSGFIQPTRDDWIQIATMYYAAVLLYCIRSLALDSLEEVLRVPCTLGSSESMVSYVTVEETQAVARQILFDRLGSVLSQGKRGKQALEKVLIWPIFIAGIEAAMDPRYAGRRRFVCEALHTLSRSLGTLTLRDAKVFLCGLWSRISKQDGNGISQYWWDDIFKGAKGRCAFFM